jgi:hypothetical protein
MHVPYGAFFINKEFEFEFEFVLKGLKNNFAKFRYANKCK